MHLLYSLKEDCEVNPKIGDLVQLKITHFEECFDSENGRFVSCRHAVIASVAGPWVTIKHYNGLVGFPFEEETAIPIHGCVQILNHDWAKKQGDTWTRVERV